MDRAGGKIPHDAQARRSARPEVGGTDREAVHRGVVRRRHVEGRLDVIGEDVPERAGERDLDGGGRRRDAGEDASGGVGDRDHRRPRPLL